MLIDKNGIIEFESEKEKEQLILWVESCWYRLLKTCHEYNIEFTKRNL